MIVGDESCRIACRIRNSEGSLIIVHFFLVYLLLVPGEREGKKGEFGPQNGMGEIL